MAKTIAVLLCIACASAVPLTRNLRIGGPGVALVHDYIADTNCKENYIRKHKPACLRDGQCFPAGTETSNNCVTHQQWQWHDVSDPFKPMVYAPGVNPSPIKRVTANGNDAQKLVWGYTGSIRQAVDRVLTDRRISQIQSGERPLSIQEFLGPLSRTHYTWPEEFMEFREFDYEVTGEKARREKADAAAEAEAEGAAKKK